MDTMSAKNFLQNTEVKFKVKMIATNHTCGNFSYYDSD